MDIKKLLAGSLVIAGLFNPFSIAKSEEHLRMIICPEYPDIFVRHFPAAKGAKPENPVIFIHGSSFPSALSIAFDLPGGSGMDRLSNNGFDMWAFDFAGYGGSGRYPQMAEPAAANSPVGDADDAARQLSCVIDHVLSQTGARQVSLFAHSAGTMPAGLYAGQYSGKIDRLVLFGPVAERQPGSDSLEYPESAWELVTNDDQYDSFVRDVPADADPVFSKQTMALWGTAYLAGDPASAQRTPPAVKVPTGLIRDVIAAWNGRLVYDPALITAPTLIIYGEWDGVTTDEDALWLYGGLKNARSRHMVRLPEGTHRMHLEENRGALYRAVENFLRNEEVKGENVKENAMIGVLFEVIPKAAGKEAYLDLAAELRPELDKVDGFISIERFQSLNNPDKVLSLSFWRDERAVAQWRAHLGHQNAQNRGRSELFADYHIRIMQVIREYGMKPVPTAPLVRPE